MRLLNGQRIANKILYNLSNNIKNRKIRPGLAVILVGNDPASEIYVKLKAKAAKQVGIKFKLARLSKNTTEKTIISNIKKLNADNKINGMIVQLPLPKKHNLQKIFNSINPYKDADGFNPENIKNFLSGKTRIFPVFPLAIMKILESARVDLENKKVLIIANSNQFGIVMSQALKRKKVRVGYILAKDLSKNIKLLKEADIIVTAVGKSRLIRGEMIKKGAILIDGGITKINKKVIGDVDFKSVESIVSHLSPVPGGVGPVTIACLLDNVYKLSNKKITVSFV